MKQFRKKQRLLKRLLNSLLVITAIYIIFFIGAEPYLKSAFGSSAVFNYLAQGLIVLSLIFLFVYYSRYSKSDKFLENTEYIISDAGYYLTSREEKSADAYEEAVIKDLENFGYRTAHSIESNGLCFDTRALRQKEYFYIVKTETADRNDMLAYSDAMIYDLTAVNLKRKGNAVLLMICDSAEEGAIALSKDITSLGKKGQLRAASAICELSTGRVYFLGNKITKCQQMISNFVMNCDLPIKEKFIVQDKLPFQLALEQKMESFNLKDFNNGIYNER